MTLNSLRFRALRFLWRTAHADLNKTLDMLTFLAMAMSVPYLIFASTAVGTQVVGVYILELGVITACRKWLLLSPVPSAWLLLFTSNLHIFLLAYQEGGIWGISVVWMLALPMPMLLVFGLRAALISLGLSMVSAAVLAWMNFQGMVPAMPIASEHALGAAIKFSLVVATVLSFPVITVITQRWAIRMFARRVNLLEEARKATHLAQTRQQRFVSAVSHELRTPMNAIMGFIQSPPQELLRTSQNKTLFDAMRQASKHLMTVIDDLMDFSRLQSGDLKIESVPSNLRELTTDISQIFASQLAEQGVEFVLDIHPNVPQVVVIDPNRYAQIVINLLSNAAKFTAAGRVTLTVAQTRNGPVDPDEPTQWIRVAVMDTGIGIPSEHLEALFNAFSTSTNRTNNAYGGTGLGLSISKKLVQLMAGRIHVSSEQHLGTTVSFELPLTVVANQAPVDDTDADVSPGALDNLTVLIVDDSVVNRMVLSQLLRNRLPDAVIVEAADGIEALQQLRRQSFDLILMDILMPNLNGIEATKRIKSQLRLQTPVIGLTADISGDVHAEALAAGMFALITKPFSHAHLLTRMADALAAPLATAWVQPTVQTPQAPPEEECVITQGGESGFWQTQIQRFAEQTPRQMVTQILWASTAVCMLYALTAPDEGLRTVYTGITVISLLLSLMSRFTQKVGTDFLFWIYWLATTTATTILVAWSGGLNSIASAYFVCVPLIMATMRVPRSGFAFAASAGIALLMGYFQSEGYLNMPSAAVMRSAPLWPLILFIGLALSFLIVPLLRFSHYGKLATQLREKTAQLVTSRRATAQVIQTQNDFVAAVSHELRNPIHAIAMVVNAFDEETLDNPISQQTLRYVSKSVDDLLWTIDKLLMFSQIQANKLHLNVETVSVEEWLSELKQHIENTSNRSDTAVRALHVNYRIDAHLPPILDLDPARLQHVLRELLDNAAKFSDRKPIDISLRLDEVSDTDQRTWSISVCDHGVGIAQADLAEVFDRFATVTSESRPALHGNGLGLPITRALVELMGGTVGIESQPNNGTTVTVTLPLMANDTAANRPALPATVLLDIDAPILIVDDSAINILILQNLLQRHFPAATIATASRWDDLVKYLEITNPAIVLMDVFMPNIDGQHATRLLRKIIAQRGLPQPFVMGLTADKRHETRQACLKAGMNTVVLKPFNHSALIQLIAHEAIDRRA